MEPKEASCGLHTQEVTGSSPVAPTTTPIDLKRVVRSESHRFRLSFASLCPKLCQNPAQFVALCQNSISHVCKTNRLLTWHHRR